MNDAVAGGALEVGADEEVGLGTEGGDFGGEFGAGGEGVGDVDGAGTGYFETFLAAGVGQGEW